MLAMSGIALRSEERRLVARNCGGNAAPGCLSAVDWRPTGRSSTGLKCRIDDLGHDCRWATTATRFRPAVKSFKAQSFKARARTWAGAPGALRSIMQSRDGEPEALPSMTPGLAAG